MANGNFIVQNGLQVGPLTIDAATGSINTTGTVTVGGVSVSEISKNDSSIRINDTGTSSNITFVVDSVTEHVMTQYLTTLNGNLAVNGIAESTSTTTGALVVAGGAGIAGAVHAGSIQATPIGSTTASTGAFTSLVAQTETVGGLQANAIGNITPGTGLFTTLGANGIVTITNTTDNNGTQYTSGALQVYGGAGIHGSLYVQGNVYAGNIISASSTTLVVDNPLVYLQGSNPETYNYEIGMYSHFGNSSIAYPTANYYQHTGVVRDHNDSTWKIFSNVPEPSGGTINFTNAIYDAVKLGKLTVANNTASSSTITGAVVVSGGVGIAGALNVGSIATVAGITTSAGILPSANASIDIGSTSSWFNNIYGTSTHALYADLAENYQGDKSYSPGTVVMFGGEQEVTLATANTTAVAGVVSTNPAHLMNGALTGHNVVAVAFTGRVPCNVIGPVKKGDLMVSAGFGFAKTNNDPKVGTVIGKALQDYLGETKGVIEVVVGRF